MKITIDAWVEAALNTNSDELALLFEGLPASYYSTDSIARARERSLTRRFSAFILVGTDLAYGDDLELAVSLNTAGIRLCERARALYGPVIDDTDRTLYKGNACAMSIWSLAMNLNAAYTRAGLFEERFAVLQATIEWLQVHEVSTLHRHTLTDKLALARLDYAEVLTKQGRPEEARRELGAALKEAEAAAALDTEANARFFFYSSYEMLNDTLDQLLNSATERKDTRSPEELKAHGMQRLEEVISTRLPNGGTAAVKPVVPDETVAALTELYGEFWEFAYLSEQDARKFAEEWTGNSADGMVERLWEQHRELIDNLRFNEACRKGSAVLLDPGRSRDPAELDKVRIAFEPLHREAVAAGLEDRVIDTSWVLAVCYSRLGRFGESLGMTQAIRAWINRRRVLIQDPLKRATTSTKYPYLYMIISDSLMELGDKAELLSVIEESKGRALVDLLAVEAHQEDQLVGPESAHEWLPALMTRLDSHYVTFLMDDEVTYAVCVTKRGELHAARLPVGTRLLDELRDDLDPSRWGRKTNGFFASPSDVPQQLSPLVDWLGQLVDAGALHRGDHICYAPDDLLHLVPLHYVDFRGEPLVKWFSVSRTHSAVLLHHFAGKTCRLPSWYLAVKVPLADEAENDPGKVARLGRVSEWLGRGPLKGTRLDDGAADLAALAGQKLVNAVVHFATHGCFPRPGEATNPFRDSGLILSKSGRLPASAKDRDLFSPERIIAKDSRFKFDGSHLSLQACVSGLSEEGIGGDLLGLEWSLLLAGARSILSTHWNVPVESSADFCIRFYEEWLVNGQSRAQAWRNAVLSLMDNNQLFEGRQAHHWAAFSLAGDWR